MVALLLYVECLIAYRLKSALACWYTGYVNTVSFINNNSNNIPSSHTFQPLVLETLGPVNSVSWADDWQDVSGDWRETMHLF